ncbi:hypothetical protein HOH67_04510 [Candidatus Peregrinibacteria bacterium]|nr:hypothetical protein [Candidatus Peregrinibacteria bacterium]
MQFHRSILFVIFSTACAPSWWIDPNDVNFKLNSDTGDQIEKLQELAFQDDDIYLELNHFSARPENNASSGSSLLFVAIVESAEESSVIINLNEERIHMRTLSKESPWLLWHNENLSSHGVLGYFLEIGNLEGSSQSEIQVFDVQHGQGREALIINSNVAPSNPGCQNYTWEYTLRSQDEPSAYLELLHEDSYEVERYPMQVQELPQEDLWLASTSRSLDGSSKTLSWILTANENWWNSSEPTLVTTH